MKKSLAIILAVIFVLGIAGTALAAPNNPFVDVPAKHWAYDAVNKLAKAGIVDGYGDGTFRGDRTMTRYEMAQVVAKAMARSDKADAANKALIDKLAVEFAAELNNLGVRVAKLEEKTKIGWKFESRIRYSDAKFFFIPHLRNGTDRFDWRQRITLNGDVNENISYVARLETGNQSGDVAFGTPGNQTIGFNLAYFNVKDFLDTFDQLSIGRLDTRGVTNGLLNGKDANNDGFKLTKKFGDATFNILFTDQGQNSEVALYNLDFKPADNLKINVGYQTGNWSECNWYPIGNFTAKSKSFDAGAQWKLGDFYLTGEYVKTKMENFALPGTYKAYAVQLTNGVSGYFYPTNNIVDPQKAHTDAFAIAYRKTEGYATPVMSGFNARDALSIPGYSDCYSKGYYFTYQNAVSKGVIWTMEYRDLRILPFNPEPKFQIWSTSFQFFF